MEKETVRRLCGRSGTGVYVFANKEGGDGDEDEDDCGSRGVINKKLLVSSMLLERERGEKEREKLGAVPAVVLYPRGNGKNPSENQTPTILSFHSSYNML